MKKPIIIHKLQISKYITTYYFTKSENRCLCVECDIRNIYSKESTSGSTMEIEIHYQNSWIKENLTQITIDDVPQVIKDVLRYLC